MNAAKADARARETEGPEVEFRDGRAHAHEGTAAPAMPATTREGPLAWVYEIARVYLTRTGRCSGNAVLGPCCPVLVRVVIERGTWVGYALLECEVRS